MRWATRRPCWRSCAGCCARGDPRPPALGIAAEAIEAAGVPWPEDVPVSPFGAYSSPDAFAALLAGAASGLFSTAQQLSGVIGVALLGTVFFGYLNGHSFEAAIVHTAPYAMGAFALCAVMSMLLPRTAASEEALEGRRPREVRAMGSFAGRWLWLAGLPGRWTCRCW